VGIVAIPPAIARTDAHAEGADLNPDAAWARARVKLRGCRGGYAERSSQRRCDKKNFHSVLLFSRCTCIDNARPPSMLPPSESETEDDFPVSGTAAPPPKEQPKLRQLFLVLQASHPRNFTLHLPK